MAGQRGCSGPRKTQGSHSVREEFHSVFRAKKSGCHITPNVGLFVINQRTGMSELAVLERLRAVILLLVLSR
jgi:hypothetical protein